MSLLLMNCSLQKILHLDELNMRQDNTHLYTTIQSISTYNNTMHIYIQQYNAHLHTTIQCTSTYNNTMHIYIQQYNAHLHKTIKCTSTYNNTMHIYIYNTMQSTYNNTMHIYIQQYNAHPHTTIQRSKLWSWIFLSITEERQLCYVLNVKKSKQKPSGGVYCLRCSVL